MDFSKSFIAQFGSFYQRSDKTVSRLARRRFSHKTNEQKNLFLFCFFHGKKNKFVHSFFEPICFWFYLTFSWVVIYRTKTKTTKVTHWISVNKIQMLGLQSSSQTLCWKYKEILSHLSKQQIIPQHYCELCKVRRSKLHYLHCC